MLRSIVFAGYFPLCVSFYNEISWKNGKRKFKEDREREGREREIGKQREFIVPIFFFFGVV
jgi:hypothetical protein